MRILLDENLNWRLKRQLGGHVVESVRSLGWTGTKNGQLLQRAVDAKFEAMITMDDNLVNQQVLAKYDIAVIVLRAVSNRLEDTSPLMPAVLEIITAAPKRQRTVVSP
jgi:predicted nuclease of predicted toxin-antitoxin system